MIGPFCGGFLQHGTVMAHGGAHAAGLAMAFQKVGGIEINADATGGTRPRREPGRV